MKKALIILAVLVFAGGVAFAAVGYRTSAGVLGTATDIYPNAGLSGSSFDGSILNLDASVAAVTSGTVSGATITGSTLNSSSVGASSASTGKFTTLSTTGNVGIGTSSPNVSLGVGATNQFAVTSAGAVTAASLDAATIGTNTAAAGNFTTIGVTTAGTGKFTTLQATSNSSLVGTYVNGNVGIGTSVPRAPLEVTGNLYASGNIGIGSTTPNHALDISGNLYTSGNIGIGSTNPTQGLDVDTGIYFGPSAIATGSNAQVACVQAGRLGHVTGGTVTAPTCTVP